MKGYKYLIPLVLIVLMVYSIYSTISTSAGAHDDYETHLAEARKLADLDVIEDALNNYQSALDIRDTVEIRLEVGEMYLDHDWLSEAISWGENVVERYPYEPSAYTFLLKCRILAEHYGECFELRDEAEARKAENDEFRELLASVEYIYELGYEYYDDVSVFSNGFCAVKSEDLWGYSDNFGDSEIEEQFLHAGAFSSDGVAAVQDENGEFYYIAESGNKKIAMQNLQDCTDLGMSINQIIPACDGDVYNYYDPDFNLLFQGDFTHATPVNAYAAAEKDGQWFLIDPEGNRTTTEAYDAVILDDKGIAFRNDRAFVSKDGQIFMIDASGNRIGETGFEDAVLFRQADSYAAVQTDGKWGFIDKDGTFVIEPQFENARSFCNGYAAVKIDGLWGFIDETGTVVIEPQFSDAKDFNENGCVFIQQNSQWNCLKLLKYNY